MQLGGSTEQEPGGSTEQGPGGSIEQEPGGSMEQEPGESIEQGPGGSIEQEPGGRGAECGSRLVSSSLGRFSQAPAPIQGHLDLPTGQRVPLVHR